ncbi:MAG TPA: division/cell wall cluster transcriptional repressor MraZ [Sphingomonas sp.]
MALRGRYQGHGIGLVDDKGRVAIPSPLRTTLAANAPRTDGKDGGTIVVAAHEQSPCLIAYDPAYLDILGDDLDRREAESLSGGHYDYNLKRAALSGESAPFDGSGRFIMPAFARFHANITDHAFFYGQLHYIEIWDPRTLVADDTLPDVMRKMARFYMAEKGVTL